MLLSLVILFLLPANTYVMKVDQEFRFVEATTRQAVHSDSLLQLSRHESYRKRGKLSHTGRMSEPDMIFAAIRAHR